MSRPSGKLGEKKFRLRFTILSNYYRKTAGYCCRSADKVLLLEKKSKHSDQKWELPGGKFKPVDWTLLDTASREAREELGGVPQYELLTEIKTRQVPSSPKACLSGLKRSPYKWKVDVLEGVTLRLFCLMGSAGTT